MFSSSKSRRALFTQLNGVSGVCPSSLNRAYSSRAPSPGLATGCSQRNNAGVVWRLLDRQTWLTQPGFKKPATCYGHSCRDRVCRVVRSPGCRSCDRHTGSRPSANTCMQVQPMLVGSSTDCDVDVSAFDTGAGTPDRALSMQKQFVQRYSATLVDLDEL